MYVAVVTDHVLLFGAGSFQNGQHFLSFGTSAWIAGTSDRVFLDKEKTLICFGHVITGKYMPCGTMQAAGSSYSIFAERFVKKRKKLQKRRENLCTRY